MRFRCFIAQQQYLLVGIILAEARKGEDLDGVVNGARR
jgi:hypothetical protein